MSVWKFAIALIVAIHAVAAELPTLRIEATNGGSMIHLRNGSTQPLTAWLIELVGYPGSSFSLLQDELSNAIPPGSERSIPVSNMMVGAAPEYVKVQAVLYADGSSAGLAEKITQLVARRRITLETTRELIRRLESAQSAGTAKAALIAGLKEWAGSVRQPAARSVIAQTVLRLEARLVDETLAGLRASERVLTASKPPLH